MIFVDSTYFVSLLVPKNDKDNVANEIVIPETERLVINNLVLTEVLNLVSKKSRLNIHDIYNMIKKNVDIVCLTNEDYLKAIDLCVYYNNSINFSDCLILITMENLGIDTIISFDSGFKKVKGLKIIDK